MLVFWGVAPEVVAATTLTQAIQVHGLAPQVANSNLPARIEGVVTHYHRELGDGLTLQDETDGVYVSLRGRKPEVRVGTASSSRVSPVRAITPQSFFSIGWRTSAPERCPCPKK